MKTKSVVHMPEIRGKMAVLSHPTQCRQISLKTVIGIDTGASSSFMSDSLLAFMRDKFPKATMRTGTVGTGNGDVTVARMEGLKICVGGCCGRTDILFMPLPARRFRSGLNLGMDFLKNSGMALDLGKCRLSCKKRKIPMTCPVEKQ